MTLLLSTERMIGARTSLRDAARYVFGLTPSEHQDLWLDALEGVERGDISRLCVIAPPGHAKSTYHSIVFPTWYLGKHYNASIIGVTTTDPLGQLYGDTVRERIESPEFRAVFRNVEPWYKRGWSKLGAFVRGPIARNREQKDASLVFVGAGGAVIGRRADGVIVDDAVDEATARSETLLTARKLWMQRSVMSRLRPGGWRIVAGTLWAEEDVVDTAMQSGEYVVIHMAARGVYQRVEADVFIPNGVKWRPSRPYTDLTNLGRAQ